MYKLRHTIIRPIHNSKSDYCFSVELKHQSWICYERSHVHMYTYSYIHVRAFAYPHLSSRKDDLHASHLTCFEFRCFSALRTSAVYDIDTDVDTGHRHYGGITRANRAAATPIDAAQFWACHKFRSPILSEMLDAARPTTLRFGPGMPGPPCAKFRWSLNPTWGEKFSGSLMFDDPKIPDLLKTSILSEKSLTLVCRNNGVKCQRPTRLKISKTRS